MNASVRGWWAEVWPQVAEVWVLTGGEGSEVDAPERELLAVIEDPVELAELRRLTTAGRFDDGICRCHGGLTLGLRGADGEGLGRASVHGTDRISWERSRFGDDLTIGDPLGLGMLLARHGLGGWLTHFVGELVGPLGLREGRPQYRQAGSGASGSRLLAARRVPPCLRPYLTGVSGIEAGKLPEEEVSRLRAVLAAEHPDGGERARLLLAWLGRLTWPIEAEHGEGLLVRRLLEGLDPVAAAAAADAVVVAGGTVDGYTAMGLLCWARGRRHVDGLAGLVGPVLARYPRRR
ncbi:hypothetical protein ACIA8O_14700 [Kitasatospora sp. NPDC051853]|uniref:hypothetical protein n=1 Tax=Kitasatospora sp. NPDC051853 TaxID=3364058 RepID=UPI0037A37A6D